MSQQTVAQCDHCGTIATVRSPSAHPDDWVAVYGPDPFRRKDFCSWACLVNWAGGAAVGILAQASTT